MPTIIIINIAIIASIVIAMDYSFKSVFNCNIENYTNTTIVYSRSQPDKPCVLEFVDEKEYGKKLIKLDEDDR